MLARPHKLNASDVCIVVAYAPAGLGHLRVSRALIDGLPHGTQPMLLPDNTTSVSFLHRITSTYRPAQRLLEWTQQGTPEKILAKLYIWFLHKDAYKLEQKLIQTLSERIHLPKTLVVVATHFGIAHQVAYIKRQLEAKTNTNVILAVCVTDDSPQRMWHVPGADIILAPSEQTQKELRSFGIKKHMNIVTSAYPVSPSLTQTLEPDEWVQKQKQADPESNALIHIAIPISGAGVGLHFTSLFMTHLHKLEPRTRFHIVSKRTMFTLPYLKMWDRRDYVSIAESHSDRQVVTLYQELYERIVIGYEVTKPSEQAFKTMIPPRARGGVTLLFTDPVGRQEYDNLHFLQRHGRIPSGEEEHKLCDVLELKTTAVRLPWRNYRGFRIPNNPKTAATWFSRCLNLRFFQTMQAYTQTTTEEWDTNGVSSFWKEIARMI